MFWKKEIAEEGLIKEFVEECNITELQAKLLYNRGIRDIETANKYIYGDLRDLYDPLDLIGIKEALKILKNARKNNKRVLVVADFDTDGITGAVLTNILLNEINIETKYYIPHRTLEGYGLSIKIVDYALDNEFDIIYTVDNGIAAATEVDYAISKGLEVIITDHHNIPETIPKAQAIVNPKLKCDYKNKDLCGCGVSWKVLYQLYKELNMDLQKVYHQLGLVAIATVGDMMNLQDENRILVKEGIKCLNKGYNVGINNLKQIFKLNEIKSEDISFRYTPCINSDGRLGTGYNAARLLEGKDTSKLSIILSNIIIDLEERVYSTYDVINYKKEIKKETNLDVNEEDTLYTIKEKLEKHISKLDDELEQLANYLYEINEVRKEKTKYHYEECLKIIEENKYYEDEVIVVYKENMLEGLIGLVASKIKEHYQKPTFILTNSLEVIKGSGRGVEGHPLSLFEALQLTSGLWEKGGGHTMAAGLSFKKDLSLIDLFRKKLNEYSLNLLKETEFTSYLNIDAIINKPTENICKEIDLIQPTGLGNPSATFGTGYLNVLDVEEIGDKTHLKIKLENNITGIAFSFRDSYLKFNSPEKIKVAYTPNINNFSFYEENRKITIKRVQMMIKDINIDENKTTFSNKKALKSMFDSFKRLN